MLTVRPCRPLMRFSHNAHPMENNAPTRRTVRPAMAPLGNVVECTAPKPLLDVLGAFDAVVIVDSSGLEQPGNVVRLARILVAAFGERQCEDGVSSGFSVACRV